MPTSERTSLVNVGFGANFFDSLSRRGGNLLASLPYKHFPRTPGVFLVGNPMDIRSVFGDEHGMDKQGFLYDPRDEFADGLLSMASGETWKAHQHVVAPTLAPHSISGLVETVIGKTTESLHSWFISHNGSKLRMQDVYHSTKVLDMQIMVRALMGRDISREKAEGLVRAHSFGSDFFRKNLRMLGAYYAIGRRHPRLFEYAHREFNVLREFAEESINNPVAGTLTEVLHTAVETKGMTMREATGEFIQMLAASFGTTAASVTWALSYLSRPQHIRIQERVRHELSESQDLTPNKDSLLHRAFLESLRLRPPAHMTVRMAARDLQWDIAGKTRFIPKGSWVLNSLYVAHHIPEFWERPHIFDPERFLPSRFGKKQNAAFMPFGVGLRSCTGKNIALHVGPLILETLLRDRKLIDRSTREPRMEFGASLRPKNVLTLDVERV